MTEAKHTHGTWTANGRSVTAVGSVNTWSGPVHGTIAVFEETVQTDRDGRTWIASGTPEANARLCAAAPCLLDALRWFIEDIDGDNTTMADFDENVAKARAAIAKATGSAS